MSNISICHRALSCHLVIKKKADVKRLHYDTYPARSSCPAYQGLQHHLCAPNYRERAFLVMMVSQDSQNLAASLPPDHPFAASFTIATRPVERPSHPSPHHSHMTSLLGPKSRPPRPHLKVDASLPASKLSQIHQPLPVKHPNHALYCKTSPATAPSYILQQQHATGQTRRALMHREALIACGSDTTLGPEQPLSARHIPQSVDAIRFNKGHARRLSDKFKHLFLTVRRKTSNDEELEETKTSEDLIQAKLADESTLRRQQSDHTLSTEININLEIPPIRPRRSPGTASFLVSRHLSYRQSGRSVFSATSRSSSKSSLSGTSPQWANRTWRFPVPLNAVMQSSIILEKNGQGLVSQFSDPSSSSSNGSDDSAMPKSKGRSTASPLTDKSSEVDPTMYDKACYYKHGAGDFWDRWRMCSFINEDFRSQKVSLRRVKSLPEMMRRL